MAADKGKKPDVDPVAAAMAKLEKARAAADAMEKAREKMGLMTNAAKAAAREQERLAKAQQAVAKASEKSAASAANKAAREQTAATKQAAKADADREKSLKKMSDSAAKAAATEQKRNLAKMAKDQKDVASAQAKQAKSSEALAKANASIEFEPVTRPMEAFQKAIKSAGPEAQAAAAAATMWAAALVGLGAAVTKTIHFVTDLVMKMSILRSQFMALARGGPGAGAATLASLNALAAKLPFAQSQVQEWGKSLMMAKLQGRDLENAVKAVAGAAALMGDSGAAAATSLFETLARGGMEAMSLVRTLKMGLPAAQSQLAQLGLRVEDVAAALGTSVQGMKNMRLNARQMAEAIQKALAVKAAGPLGEMMLTWPVLAQKAKESFLALFEKLGPAVKPFMKAVQSLFGEFKKGSPTMAKLQGIVTAVFTTVFAWGTKAVNVVHGFVKTLTEGGKQSGAMKALGSVWDSLVVSARMVWNTIKGVVGVFRIFIGNANGMRTISAVFRVIVAVVGFFITTFARLAAVTFMVIGALVALAGIVIGGVASAIGYVLGLVGEMIDALSDIGAGAAAAGSNFVSGLLDGITSGAGAIVDAVKNIASSALGAFKSALGIASPSKVMMKMGSHIAEGAAVGMDKGADGVGASASRLGGAVASGAAGGMGKGGAKGSMQVTFGERSIVIEGAGKSALEITEEMIAAVFERLAAQQGLMGAR